MFEAKGIDFSQIPDLPSHYEASAPGVGLCRTAGVAKAVEEVIHRLHPEVEVKTAAAEGLNESADAAYRPDGQSMTAICWRAWPAPAGVLPAAALCSRRRNPAVHWRSIRRRYLSVTRWTPSIWRGPACCTKTKRTGTAWVGIDEFGVQKERKRSRWGAFARCDEDGGGSRRVPPHFDRMWCYNGRQQSAYRQPGGGGMGV